MRLLVPRTYILLDGTGGLVRPRVWRVSEALTGWMAGMALGEWEAGWLEVVRPLHQFFLPSMDFQRAQDAMAFKLGWSGRDEDISDLGWRNVVIREPGPWMDDGIHWGGVI